MLSQKSHSSCVVSLKNTKMKLLVVILFLSVSLACAHGYKILGVFPFGSKSHYAIGEATMRSLAEAGHEVTMVSVFEQKKPLPNFKQIKITDFYETVLKGKLNVTWFLLSLGKV